MKLYFFLCSLFCVNVREIQTGDSESSTMFRSIVEFSVRLGENITLPDCDITTSKGVTWNRHRSNETKLLITAEKARIGKSLLVTHNEEKNHFRLRANNEITMTNLSIIGVREADLGLYYCEIDAVGTEMQLQRATRLQLREEIDKDDLEGAQKEEGGVSVLEWWLMFGGVGLAALAFLLATAAAGRVVHRRAYQAGWRAGQDSSRLSPD